MDETVESSKKPIFGIITILLIVLVGGFVYTPKLVADNYLEQAVAAYREGAFEQAQPLFEKSIKWKSTNPLPYAYLGEIALGRPTPGEDSYYANPNYEVAIQRFESAKSRDLKSVNPGFYSKVLNDLGYAYWKTKQYKEADKNFLERIALSPSESFLPRYLVALDYVERFNKPDEALEVLLPAIDAAQLDFQKAILYKVYELLSRLYLYRDDSARVKEYADLVISSVPENHAHDIEVQIAHIALAAELAKNKDLKGAIVEIEKTRMLAANAKVPNAPNAHKCSLANTYYLAADFTKAISIANEKLANRLNKDTFAYADSICLRVLADSNFSLEKSTDAKKYMQQYLDVTEKFDEKNIFVIRNREKYEQLLKSL